MKQAISIQTTLTLLTVGTAVVLQHHVPLSDAASVRGGVVDDNDAGVLFEAGFDIDEPDHHYEIGQHEQFHDALEDHDVFFGTDSDNDNDHRQLTAAAVDNLRDRYKAGDIEQVQDQLKRWGIMGSDLADMKNNIADLGEPYDKTKDTPFFFMIPKSGTTTLGSYMTNCVTDDLVTANEVGKFYLSDTLQVVEHTNLNKYLNIDVTKRDGLDHGYELGLAESALADVIITGFPVQVASIFNSHNKARMFTLMRHPLQRIMSEFYYVQIADWEPISYKPFLKNWTLEQYVKSDYTSDNFMTRQLVGKSSKNLELTMEDAENAKNILTEKCLVGLTKDYKETLLRFKQYFGWHHDQQCFEDLFAKGGKKNSNKHPILKQGSRDYDALMKHDKFDMLLWNHAIKLFEEQAKMFEPFNTIDQ
jgi:hypothetical protein